MKDRVPAASAMVWHVFKKDWTLLRPFAVGIAACQTLLAVLHYQWEPFAPPQEVATPLGLLSLAVCIGMGVLIVLAVQQDAVSSVRQDWLTRPIRRRDLLLAKILFVLLAIHGPLVLIGLLHGLGDGFSFGEAFAAALARNGYILFVFSLPLLTIAALTASVLETILGSLAVFVGVVIVLLLLAGLRNLVAQNHHWDFVTINTDVAWVWQTVSYALLLVGMTAAVALQYFRRANGWARVSLIGALLASLLVQAMPWQPAFALQRWLSAEPAPVALTMAFDPTIGRLSPRQARSLDGMRSIDVPVQSSDGPSVEAPRQDETTLYLPLRFSGLPTGSSLYVDRSALSLVDARGNIAYHGTGGVIQLPAVTDGQGTLYQAVHIPNAVYRHLRDKALRLDIRYSLTLFGSRILPPIPALGGARRVPGVGRCATRVDAAGTAIHVGCLSAGEVPSCLSLALEHGALHNPGKLICAPDYAPFRSHFSLEALSRLNARLPFSDVSDARRFPIDGKQLQDAQVVLTIYHPISHFSAHVIVSKIRLQDWQFAPWPRNAAARVVPQAPE